MNKIHLKQAIRTVIEGGIIAYPTESVFGLGCLPNLECSVHQILKLKRRSIKKGLILVAANAKQLEHWVDFSPLTNVEIVYNSWPGPVTWLIPAKTTTPSWLTGNHRTLAVRVSAHPVVSALCKEIGPLVSTSANPQGLSPARSSLDVEHYFANKIDYIFPATISGNAKPTEIRDPLSGKIIRSAC